MIPRDYITAWRAEAPWVEDAQVEQDLVISRALVEIYSHPVLRSALAFRGGTALYKLHLKPAARYSEDIDLVQVTAEPAGPLMEALREVLDSWLGEPRWRQSEGRITFMYRFGSEAAPPVPLRLKVEINTREHFTVHGYVRQPYEISSRWFSGACRIRTYDFNELLGTKLRALYQRRKGRHLFDLSVALLRKETRPGIIVGAFEQYMLQDGQRVTRRQFEENLAAKLENRSFAADIGPLLATGYQWDLEAAADMVMKQLIAKLP